MFEKNKKQDDLFKEKMLESFSDCVISFEQSYDMVVAIVKKDKINEILSFLYYNQDLQFNFLTTLCGIHYPEPEPRLGVVYHLHSFRNNHRIRIKCFTPVSDPVFPTATNIWETANWMERETWDFFGIIFTGHPNLKRILNVDDFEGFPLRKEFPLEDQTREDKNDRMFGR
jgi:NADH-quinone oxidoreductase subunit C